ncbi:hypothetical protein [Selenomonas ruminantium]|uniref:hypothetical protein n=1 Tax=Selenomonas ruminantium TaxID=971 RepID=UPI0011612FBD|nr:hypothetical protein [Selenomonas ruminantium]
MKRNYDADSKEPQQRFTQDGYQPCRFRKGYQPMEFRNGYQPTKNQIGVSLHNNPFSNSHVIPVKTIKTSGENNSQSTTKK